MRARGIAGRHERREPGREDEDPLVAIDNDYLKLDGTEDDDDDEDDEVAQNKLLILVAKDVKTGTHAARKQRTGVSAPNAENQSPRSFSCFKPLWVSCLVVQWNVSLVGHADRRQGWSTVAVASEPARPGSPLPGR